jgi:hypothetical protein
LEDGSNPDDAHSWVEPRRLVAAIGKFKRDESICPDFGLYGLKYLVADMKTRITVLPEFWCR